MKKVIAYFLLAILAVAVSKYRNKLWWERPVFDVQRVDVGPFLIYRTP